MNGSWRIRDLEQGFGTDYCLAEPGVGGLGLTIDANDVKYDTRDGSWPGAESYAARVLTFPITIAPPHPHLMTAEERRRYTMPLLHALTSAWRRIDQTAEGYEIPLDLRLDGLSPTDELRFYGRPRGPLAIDASAFYSAGALRVLAQFGCLDPIGYGAEVTLSLPVGTTVVTNEGLAASERWEAEFPNGDVNPSLTHAGTGVELDLTGTTIAGGAYTADGRWYSLTQVTLNDVFEDLSDDSDFFALAPGANSLTVAGSAAVGFSYRPAWLV